MTSSIPQSPLPVAGTFDKEANINSTFDDLYRALNSLTIRVSKNSPPVLNKDVLEGQLVLDRSALRIYTVVNQTLRYWSLT